MTRKITISVPDYLYEKLERWKYNLRPSKIFQEAASREIAKKEMYQVRFGEEKTIPEVFETADFETDAGQFEAGKEVGFIYAKTSPYPEVKRFEKYVKNWDKKHPEELNSFHHDLDIPSLLVNAGLLVIEDEPIPNVETDALPIRDVFDKGVLQGIIDFLNEECTAVEVEKLGLERDRKMIFAKYGEGKAKIFMTCISKMMSVGEQEKKGRKGRKS